MGALMELKAFRSSSCDMAEILLRQPLHDPAVASSAGQSSQRAAAAVEGRGPGLLEGRGLRRNRQGRLTRWMHETGSSTTDESVSQVHVAGMGGEGGAHRLGGVVVTPSIMQGDLVNQSPMAPAGGPRPPAAAHPVICLAGRFPPSRRRRHVVHPRAGPVRLAARSSGLRRVGPPQGLLRCPLVHDVCRHVLHGDWLACRLHCKGAATRRGSFSHLCSAARGAGGAAAGVRLARGRVGLAFAKLSTTNSEI